MLREIAHGMTRQIGEEVGAQIGKTGDHHAATEPTAETSENIFQHEQAEEHINGSRKPEAGSRKPEAGSRKPEAGSRKPVA
jgi:hypothetical protein